VARYAGLDAEAARGLLSRRAQMIHAMTGRCQLTMTGANRQSIQLDGVMVMAPPDRVRLRVWKLDQAVFDLTVLPDGLWIEMAPQMAGANGTGALVPATLSAARLTRELALLLGGFFNSGDVRYESSSGGDLFFRRPDSDGTSIVCQVDSATATARRFTLCDSAGRTRFSLEMSAYRDVEQIAWPMHLVALDPGNASEIDVTFSEVEFNRDLAPRAFIPPQGAKKQP
jgi:hypothetical protein